MGLERNWEPPPPPLRSPSAFPVPMPRHSITFRCGPLNKINLPGQEASFQGPNSNQQTLHLYRGASLKSLRLGDARESRIEVSSWDDTASGCVGGPGEPLSLFLSVAPWLCLFYLCSRYIRTESTIFGLNHRLTN